MALAAICTCSARGLLHVSIFYPRASRTLGETENRCRPSIYLAVEYCPRSGRAGGGEDRSLGTVRLGDRPPKSQQGCWLDGVVSKTEDQQGNVGWPEQGGLSDSGNSSEVLAQNFVAELLKTVSASKGESRGRERRRIADGTSNEEEGNDDDQHCNDQDCTGDKSKGKKVVGNRRKTSNEELVKGEVR